MGFALSLLLLLEADREALSELFPMKDVEDSEVREAARDRDISEVQKSAIWRFKLQKKRIAWSNKEVQQVGQRGGETVERCKMSERGGNGVVTRIEEGMGVSRKQTRL